MAYLIYRKTTLPGGHFAFEGALPAKLGGGGLISNACKPLLKNRDTPWAISEAELLAAGGFTAIGHALIINTTPDREEPDVFQVRSVAGYSYEKWTPIVIFMEVLCNGDLTIRGRFNDRKSSRLPVRTILYLQGGYGGGGWNWGGNSRTTAAVLWDDAWRYFKKVDASLGQKAGRV